MPGFLTPSEFDPTYVTPDLQPDRQAYQQLKVRNLTNVVNENAKWSSDPQLVNTIAQSNKVSPDVMARALKWASMQQQYSKTMEQQHNMSQAGFTGWHDFISSTRNALSNLWGHLNNSSYQKEEPVFVNGKPVIVGGKQVTLPAYLNPSTDTKPQFSGIDQLESGIRSTVTGAYKGLNAFASRATQTALQSLGVRSANIPYLLNYTTPQGESPEQAASTSINNFNHQVYSDLMPFNINDLSQLPKRHFAQFFGNLFNSNSVYFLPLHVMSYYMTLEKKYGADYAIGAVLPNILLGLSGAGAFEESAVAQDSIDQATLVSAASKADSGMQLTPEEEQAVRDAQTRLKSRSTAAEAAKNNLEATLNKAGETPNALREAVAKKFEFVSKPIGSAISLARKLNTTVSSLNANIAYLATQISAEQAHPDIWQMTRDGSVYDAQGHAVTLGQATAEALGLHSDNMFFSPTSGLIDFWSKFVVADPVGTVGKISGVARSFDGFTGELSGWFGGIGIRHGADDVYRIYSQYRSVRRAIAYIATHGAGDIMRTFRGSFSRELATILGQQQSEEEVLFVLANVADAFSMLKMEMPTMSMYTGMKAAIRGGAKDLLWVENRYGNVNGLLGSDVETIRAWRKGHGVISNGMKIVIDGASFAGNRWADLRYRSIFRHYLADAFSPSPQWVDSLTKKIEKVKIKPGDDAAIPAMMDMATAAHLPAEAVSAFGDFVASSRTTAEYVNAFLQLVYQVVMRIATSSLNRTGFDTLSRGIEEKIWDLILEKTGIDGGGAPKVWVNGPDGRAFSPIADANGKSLGSGGIGVEHLGSLKMPRAKDLVDLGKSIRRILVETSSEGMDMSKVIDNLEKLQDVAQYSEVTISKVFDNFVRSMRMRLMGADTKYPRFEGEGGAAYLQTLKELRGFGERLSRNKDLTPPEAYVRLYEHVRDKLNTAVLAIKGYHDGLLNEAMWASGEIPAEEVINVFGSDAAGKDISYELSAGSSSHYIERITAEIKPEVMHRLRGEAYAYHDLLLELNQALKGTETVDYKLMHQWASELESAKALKEKGEAEKLRNFVNGVTKAENHKLRFFPRRGLRSRWHYTVDGLNLGLSYLFVPLALLSTGWAIRVSASESILAAVREGGFKTFDAHVMNAIAKHEIYGRKMMTVEGRDERSLVRDVVAGAVLGIERSILKSMPEAERLRMLDHFVGSILRYDGHLPGGIEHGQKDVMDVEGVMRQIAEKSTNVDENGNIKDVKLSRGEGYIGVSPENNGYSTGLRESLVRGYADQLFLPIHVAIDEEQRLAGALAFNADREGFIRRAISETEKYFKGDGRAKWNEINQDIENEIANLKETMEFKRLTQEKQNAILEYLDSMRPTAESATFEAMKPYMQKSLSSVRNQIELVRKQIEQMSAKIESDQRWVEDHTKKALSTVSERYKSTMASLDRATKKVAEKESALNEATAAEKTTAYAQKNDRGRFSAQFKKTQKDYKTAQKELLEARRQFEQQVSLEISNLESDLRDRLGGTIFVPNKRQWDPLLLKYVSREDRTPYSNLLNSTDFNIRDQAGVPFFSRKPLNPEGTAHLSWDQANEMREITGGLEASDIAEKHYGMLKRYEALVRLRNDLKSNKAIASDIDQLNVGFLSGSGGRAAREEQFSHINGIPIEHVLQGDRTKAQQIADYLDYKRDSNLGSKVLREGYVEGPYTYPFKTEEEFSTYFNKIIDDYYSGDLAMEGEAGSWLSYFDPDYSWIDQTKLRARASATSEELNIYKTPSEIWAMEKAKEDSYLEQVKERDDYLKAVSVRQEASKELTNARRAYMKISEKIEGLSSPEISMAREMERLNDTRKLIEGNQALLETFHERLASLLESESTIKENYARITNEKIDRYSKRLVQSGRKNLAKLSREEKNIFLKMRARIEKRSGTYREVFTDVLDSMLAKAGDDAFNTPEKFDALLRRLMTPAGDAIKKLDPSVRARFKRNGNFIDNANYTTGDSDQDWALVNAYHVLHTVSRGQNLTSENGFRIHSYLNRQAVSGKVESSRAIAEYTSKNLKTMPVNIMAREFESHKNALKQMASPDFIIKISDKVHNNYLGKIVNSIARHHSFLLAQHNAMERMLPMIEAGILTEDQAVIKADEIAMMEMSKFFHNPLDRTNFENNVRVLAPFYFAKNQAWRRAFRVMGRDPGAFEKYIKLSLGITNYVAINSANGQIPSVSIPGSEFIGAIAGSGIFSILGLTGFGTLGFGLAADPGSIDSVVPTGSSTGWGMFGEIVRPPWGPWVTVPLKYVRNRFFSDNELAKKWVNSFLGPISANSSWVNDVFPTGVGRGIFESLLYEAGMPEPSLMSAENFVINNNYDNLIQQTYVELAKKLRPEMEKAGWSKKDQDNQLFYDAINKVGLMFTNPEFAQNFIAQAHQQTLILNVIKTAIAAGAPVAISLQEQFSAQPQLDKIMKETNPDGTKKYPSIDAAMNELAAIDPMHQFDLTAHTQSPYVSYPETQSAVDVLTNFPGLVQKNPFGAAYFVNANTPYTPIATQLETMMKLRGKENAKDYLNSLLYSMGSSYYYNYLKPSVMYLDPFNPSAGLNPQYATGTLANPQLNYKGILELKTLASQYGNGVNPTWYNEFAGATKMNAALQAYNQVKSMIEGKDALPISSLDRKRFAAAIGYYQAQVHNIALNLQEGNTSEAKYLENQWYEWCTNAATLPEWNLQARFITSVLRKLPTIKASS